MNKMKVRRAKADDIKALAEIQTSSWKVAFKDILSPEALDRYTDVERCTQILEKVFNENRGSFYIAYLNDRPCGELFWCNRQEENRSEAEIVAIHSLEETWDTGLGQLLMNKALSDIYTSGKSRVYLWVFEKNMRARRFYEKCGFTYSGESKVSHFDNVAELKYIKQM